MPRGIGTVCGAEFPAIARGASDPNADGSGRLEPRRTDPREDFLTGHPALATEDASLSPVETVVQIVTLIDAGSDATRVGLAATLSLMPEQKDGWAASRRDVPVQEPTAMCNGENETAVIAAQ